jgi:hypothetical protein
MISARASDTGSGDAATFSETLRVGAAPRESSQVAASLSERGSQFLIDKPLLDLLGANPAEGLRYYDRCMLSVTPEQLRSITITREETVISLKKDQDGSWRFGDDSARIPDAGAIETLLLLVSNIRAEYIEAAGRFEPADYGLSNPRTEVMLGLTGDAGIQKSLLIGSPSGNKSVYAMIRGQDVVFSMDKSALAEVYRSLRGRE